MPCSRHQTSTRQPITDLMYSWARDGLNVLHGPAGFIDPGFVGVVVLELSVVGSELVLWPGASVAQLIVHRLETPCARPYGHAERASKYQDQDAVTASRTHLEVAPCRP